MNSKELFESLSSPEETNNSGIVAELQTIRQGKLKVRFHLSKGQYYRQWQVKTAGGYVYYFDPEKYTLVLSGCKLRNQQGTAKKIFDGANKTVCAWVECDEVDVYPAGTYSYNAEGRVDYNPRNNPFWTDEKGFSVDNATYGEIVSENRSLYVASKL